MSEATRQAILFFLYYLLVGQVINWGSLFITLFIFARVCRDDDRMFVELAEKHRARAIGFNCPTWPEVVKMAVTMVLWPLNTYNTLVTNVGGIREALERKRKK